MARVRGKLPPGPIVWPRVARNIVTGSQGQVITRFFMFFVCLTAMFMTGSRGGVLVSLFSMVLASVLFLRRDLPRVMGILVVLVAAGAVSLGLLHFLGGNVESRVDTGGLVEQGRLAAYRSSLRIIADYPWFGTGLGTFRSIFPAYRSGEISIFGVWDVAHSTPLELAVEFGLPLFFVTAAGWIVAILVLIRGTGRSRRDTVVPLIALAVSLIALVHSSIDFSLQVPGYAIVVFALVGVGLGQSLDTNALPHHRRRRSQSRDDKLRDFKNAADESADAESAETELSEGGLSIALAYIRSWLSSKR